MTRMTDALERHREQGETAQMRLGRAWLLIEKQIALRVRQAMRRDEHLEPLLAPVMEQLDEVIGAVRSAQDEIGRLGALAAQSVENQKE